MDFRLLKRTLSERGIVYVRRTLTTQQKLTSDMIENAINSGGASVESLTDSDGIPQFILGVTPMNSSVRVGHGIGGIIFGGTNSLDFSDLNNSMYIPSR